MTNLPSRCRDPTHKSQGPHRGPRIGTASASRLTFGELLAPSGFVQTDFLALDFARVAGYQAGLRQRRLELPVIVDQGAGDPVPHRTGLTRLSAAVHVDHNVEGRLVVDQLERLAHDHASRFAGKE